VAGWIGIFPKAQRRDDNRRVVFEKGEGKTQIDPMPNAVSSVEGAKDLLIARI